MANRFAKYGQPDLSGIPPIDPSVLDQEIDMSQLPSISMPPAPGASQAAPAAPQRINRFAKYGRINQLPSDLQPEGPAPAEAQANLAETIAEQGLQGATFGFSDELIDPLAAGAASLITGENYGDMLRNARAQTAVRLKKEMRDRPGVSIASQIAGGFATGGAGLSTKAGAAAGNFLRTGNVATRIAKGAASGAASSAAYSIGSGMDGDRTATLGRDALLGAAIGGALPAAGGLVNRLNTKTVIPNSEQIRDASRPLFQEAERIGANLPSNVADSFRKRVLSTLNLDSEAKLFASNPVAERLVSGVQDFMGQPMTFNTARQIDEALGDLAYGTMDNFGKLSSEGKKFLDLQGTLRDTMENIPGNETVKRARALWSASLRMREIERIIERSKSKEQPVTALKNGFSALLNRGDKLKGYSIAEVKAIRKAAETGIITDAFKLAGSGLIPIGASVTGAVGGIPGAAGGYLAGFAVQQGAKATGIARQMGRANAASRSVAERAGMVETSQRIAIPELFRSILLMPPAQAKKTIETLPAEAKQEITRMLMLPAPGKASALPMSEREIAVARTRMERRGNPNPVDGSGAATIPPVNQILNVKNRVGVKRQKALDDMAQMLRDGDMSQNEFVKKAMQRFGINQRQARQMAKDARR